jgi:hypothetical protein
VHPTLGILWHLTAFPAQPAFSQSDGFAVRSPSAGNASRWATSTRRTMFKGIRTASELIKQSLILLGKRPSLLVPLLTCWVLYAPIVLYFKFFFDWSPYPTSSVLLIVLGIITVFSLIIGVSCLILLELIEQIENNENVSVLNAFWSVIKSDFLRALPILLVWALLWFIIHVIQAFFRRRNSSGKDENFSAQNAARTLAGMNSSWSLSGAFFEALKKGLRMIVFLILPAIAWEELSPISATKKGLSILRAHISEFATGFVLSEAVSVFAFLPAAIIVYVTDKFDIVLSNEVWFGVIIYCAFAWSFSLYIEQMFAAELYLWHMKWVEASEIAKKNKKSPPTFRRIKPPSILDDVPELVKLKNVA